MAKRDESKKQKKSRGCCGAIVLGMVAAVAFVCAFLFFRHGGTGEDGGFSWTAVESAGVRWFLRDYLEADTPVLYAKDDGIGEAFRAALENRVPRLCVVGQPPAAEGYINSAESGSAFDTGVIRTMPYSTFWLRSFTLSVGSLPALSLDKEAEGEPVYIYDFDYYEMTEAEIQELKDGIDREADDIIACIPPDADLWQTCKTVHDELIRRITYDHDFEDHCHDLCGALVKHSAVCEGYALAFRYILNRTGEACSVVVSDANSWSDGSGQDRQAGERDGDSMGIETGGDGRENTGDSEGQRSRLETDFGTVHAWNRIDAPTQERYIDVTWDDTGYTDVDGEQIIGYDYFGLTEEEMAAVDGHAFRTEDASADEILGGEGETFNYYRHEGYLLSEYDWWEVAGLFAAQYNSGSCWMTVRFDDPYAYQEAKSAFAADASLNDLMLYLGYYGYYWYSWNDDLYIFSIGLGKI